MKEKILIATELFEPLNAIGAIRPSKLARYLTGIGYSVDVFTSWKTRVQCGYQPAGFRVFYDQDRYPDPSPAHTAGPNAMVPAAKSRMWKLLAVYRRFWVSYRNGVEFSRNFENAVNSGVLHLEDYRCVFSTFGPVGSLLTGRKAKKLNPRLMWINDFRDPMLTRITPFFFRPLYGYLQHKSILECDSVTTVSEGYRKRIQFAKVRDKISVIPNGYDTQDIVTIETGNNASPGFSLTYAGSLYQGKRDLSALFESLKKVCDEKVLTREQIVFHYAGSDSAYLLIQAKRFGMEDIIRDHGSLNRKDCLTLQSESRFLVLSTWNERGEEGVFPGKLIEYMLLNRPVISLVSGDLPHSEVTAVIHQYHLGISCEEADPHTKDELYQWLLLQAKRYSNGEDPLFVPDREGIAANYDWNNLVKRFCKLIDSCYSC